MNVAAFIDYLDDVQIGGIRERVCKELRGCCRGCQAGLKLTNASLADTAGRSCRINSGIMYDTSGVYVEKDGSTETDDLNQI